jgi:transmembrane sensor
MDQPRFSLLLQKYLQKTATPEERAEFFSLLEHEDIDALSHVQDDIPEELFARLPAAASARILNEVLERKRRIMPWWRMAAAAAVFFAFTGGLYLAIHQHPAPKVIVAQKLGGANDRKPGHTGALLTLSNGQTIVLDTAHNGAVASGFIKTSDALRVNNATVQYATLSTPAGRQQKLTLSDGTLVYLNAGSSITFPTTFGSGERSVSVTGEVYFEIQNDANHPFIVKAGHDEIRDLGTRFNVNAYNDEPGIKTTLISGKVQINNQYVLKPGEQFCEGQTKEVDAENAIAWMSGYFHFEHDDITTVMRQVARWYDLKVTYEGHIPTQQFGGDIQRNLMLSEVLEILGGTGIDYKLAGNNLIIKAR